VRPKKAGRSDEPGKSKPQHRCDHHERGTRRDAISGDPQGLEMVATAEGGPELLVQGKLQEVITNIVTEAITHTHKENDEPTRLNSTAGKESLCRSQTFAAKSNNPSEKPGDLKRKTLTTRCRRDRPTEEAAM